MADEDASSRRRRPRASGGPSIARRPDSTRGKHRRRRTESPNAGRSWRGGGERREAGPPTCREARVASPWSWRTGVAIPGRRVAEVTSSEPARSMRATSPRGRRQRPSGMGRVRRDRARKNGFLDSTSRRPELEDEGRAQDQDLIKRGQTVMVRRSRTAEVEGRPPHDESLTPRAFCLRAERGGVGRLAPPRGRGAQAHQGIAEPRSQGGGIICAGSRGRAPRHRARHRFRTACGSDPDEDEEHRGSRLVYEKRSCRFASCATSRRRLPRSEIDDDRTHRRDRQRPEEDLAEQVERCTATARKDSLVGRGGSDAEIRSTLDRRVDLPRVDNRLRLREAFTVIASHGPLRGSRGRAARAGSRTRSSRTPEA